jgi:CheY-like chemotaxis protein
VASEIGQGSQFSVYLKKYTDNEPKAVSGIEEEQNFKGEGLILVVEDDEIIREMACDILIENGYEILSAVNGEDAVEIFSKNFHRVKGVFMDSSMPVMSGSEAFLAMKELYPDVKVLFTSGFINDADLKKAIADGQAEFLQKPYSMPELISKARAVFE